MVACQKQLRAEMPTRNAMMVRGAFIFSRCTIHMPLTIPTIPEIASSKNPKSSLWKKAVPAGSGTVIAPLAARFAKKK